MVELIEMGLFVDEELSVAPWSVLALLLPLEGSCEWGLELVLNRKRAHPRHVDWENPIDLNRKLSDMKVLPSNCLRLIGDPDQSYHWGS